jgi:xanthine dehydrogenase YagS FAD-binding subunit
VTPFTFTRAQTAAEAVAAAGRHTGARFLGGGTNLVDLMREDLEQPQAVVDVTRLSREIDSRPDGSLLIGGAVRNTALAEHPAVRERFPLITRAVVAGASPQIRNMATVAGNLLQRTRCVYFYDKAGSRCNKRCAGQGCDAMEGLNRMHAILGVSDSCIATHPSDLCVALVALDAQVHLESTTGSRVIPLTELHRLPEDHPEHETVLASGELITAIEVPPLVFATNALYTKVRDRASYAFALVSVAAALQVDGNSVRAVRLALGGVGTKPWRAFKAEAALRGQPATADSFRAAADAELADAKPRTANQFKVELARRTLVAGLTQLARHA